MFGKGAAMNPNYKVQIDVCLVLPVASKNIWMRQIRYLPFVPRPHDVIRLTSEDEESTLDLTIDSAVYDAANGMFVVEIADEALVEQYSNSGVVGEAAQVQSYKSFGFCRLNFPTAQVVRK